jgi:hypothetical protein
MSVFYQVYGTVDVRKCPEVRAILARLRDRMFGLYEMEVCEYSPGLLAVSFDVFGTFAGGVVLELDELIQSLGPYTTEPAILSTNYEYEEGELVVAATEEGARAALSSHRLRQIRLRLSELIQPDRIELASELRAAFDAESNGQLVREGEPEVAGN